MLGNRSSLKSGNINVWELQPFSQVDGHQAHFVRIVRIIVILICDQAHFLQKGRQVRLLRFLRTGFPLLGELLDTVQQFMNVSRSC